MDAEKLDANIVEKIKKLEAKFAAMGQDLSSYLEGLLQADYLNYWDYVNLDTLLTLQQPRTPYPDEMIFICYHQHTELFFKLILHELEQITGEQPVAPQVFLEKIRRCIRYFDNLEHSFDIMVSGMDREQFLQFRMALLPASGFQSAQYRLIELYSTDLQNLLPEEQRSNLPEKYTDDELVQSIYWSKGATELVSGKKTLTLRQFEQKYTADFLKTIHRKKETNVWKQYLTHLQKAPNRLELVDALRRFDLLANVFWPLAHYKAAVRYLQNDPTDIAATGGTNWQKYLPPRFQRVMFFPELWTEQEKKEWGKSWVQKQISRSGQ
ncbi:tryptophan 2,3-dioxygenase family protein [Cesiribacter andamanensis]|uniref:Tryptophan 2,3-dioxygenase n=1 Tax=Cesiribacter andamanensis AMV16 TaxID=1279009 RepID=M7N307_9BACT|nr:tryptophan 2,3-dioxygenase family protein [Cesiribacter andamanensis]EMR01672.1 Tryptophan 2,3-dioxygenase [Cesiribacter andamanensis AMV16]